MIEQFFAALFSGMFVGLVFIQLQMAHPILDADLAAIAVNFAIASVRKRNSP